MNVVLGEDLADMLAEVTRESGDKLEKVRAMKKGLRGYEFLEPVARAMCEAVRGAYYPKPKAIKSALGNYPKKVPAEQRNAPPPRNYYQAREKTKADYARRQLEHGLSLVVSPCGRGYSWERLNVVGDSRQKLHSLGVRTMWGVELELWKVRT